MPLDPFADLCAHCRLPLGGSAGPARAGPAYCCAGCRIAAAVVGRQGEHGESASLLIRVAAGVFLSMFVKSIAWMVYAAEPGEISDEMLRAFAWLMFAAAAPVIALLGGPVFVSAVRETAAGRPAMDTLIALAVGAGTLASIVDLPAGGPVYFDSTAMILVLTTLGRFLEAAARGRAAESLSALLSPTPPLACRLDEADIETEVPAASLRVGDRVRVRPGQIVPADGVILAGQAAVDQSVLTGESAPMACGPGDAVPAGAVNRDGLLTVAVAAAGDDTRAARIAALARQTLLSRGRRQRIAEGVCAVVVVPTVLLAVGTFAWWSAQAGWNTALNNSLAVLLVACPCALGLATPLATAVGVTAALRHGALLRNADVLERLAAVDLVAFDKTGSLTDGRPTVRGFHARPGVEPAEALAVAAALEAGSEHPVARAVSAFAAAGAGPSAAGDRCRLVEFRAVAGAGVIGTVELDGRRLAAGIGTPALLERVTPPGADRADRAAAPPADGSVAMLWWAGRPRAEFIIGDRLRPESAETVAALRDGGVSVTMLSGDRPEAAGAVADLLEIRAVHGGLTPEGKSARIAELRAAGHTVAFVGDGVNDGPALAAADVGMAAPGGTDLARLSADVTLLSDLRSVPTVLRVAAAVRRTIRGNLFWAFAYNSAGLAAAAAGLLTPLAAALLMTVGSLLVVGNSARLRRLAQPAPPGQGAPVAGPSVVDAPGGRRPATA